VAVVPIDIAGDRDRRVALQVGNLLDVHTGLQPRHRGAVAQGVHADAGDADILRRVLDHVVSLAGGGDHDDFA
jgi:hypothetical protein